MRRFFISLLLLAFGAASGAGITWLAVRPESAQARRLQTLVRVRDEENDRLRGLVAGYEKTKALEKSKTQREGIEKQVATIRGLSFDKPVDYAVLTREQIKSVVTGKLGEVYSEEEFANMSAAFARLGLLPAGYPLRQAYIDLLSEQIAAFYDQHQHKLFMYEDASLDNAQNQVVLAHELTHALQDQHFNLLKLPLEAKNNDDRAAAASALVEGEATVVMSDFMLRNLSLRALKDNLAASLGQSMEQLQKAPRFMREMLMFPYLRGQQFCGAALQYGGYGALSEAYSRLPSSTAQILHPEKYFANPPEEPIAIEWPQAAVNGKAAAVDNVVGEFATRILIGESLPAEVAETAADGWRGDRYLSFGAGEALVWKSVWASEKDQAEFFEAERQALEKRYTLKDSRLNGNVFEADAPRAIRLVKKGGNAVILLDAATAETAKRLEEQFAGE